MSTSREQAVRDLEDEVLLLEAQIDCHMGSIAKLEQEAQEWDMRIEFLRDKIKEIKKGR